MSCRMATWWSSASTFRPDRRNRRSLEEHQNQGEMPHGLKDETSPSGLIVVFDEVGYFTAYDSIRHVESDMEPAMAAEEPYEAFTLDGFIVQLTYCGNLAVNAVTVAIVTGRQDLGQLASCVTRARQRGKFNESITEVADLVNAGWARDLARQKSSWWNVFRKDRLPAQSRTV